MKRQLQRLAFVLATATVAGTAVLSGPAAADHDSCGTGHDMGAATTGTVTSTSRYDWWTSNSVVPARSFTLQPYGGDADLAVYSGDCSTVLCSSSAGGTAADTCAITQVGLVNVRVYYYSSPTGSVPYALSTNPVPVNAGPSPTPGVYPSDDCAYDTLGGDVASGFAGDSYVTLRTQRSGNETWVCTRVDSATASYGGKLVVEDYPAAVPALPTLDSASNACSATPGNQIPGQHPTVDILNGSVMLDLFADDDEVWVCLRAPLVNSRVVVPVNLAGTAPSATFYQDAPGRHSVAKPAPDLGSGDCQRATSGTTRAADVSTSGNRSYLYTNVTGSVAKVCVAPAAGLAGGVLTVEAGAAETQIEIDFWDMSACDQSVAVVAGYGVRSGRTADTASICLVNPTGGVRITVIGSGGEPLGVRWTPDEGSVID